MASSRILIASTILTGTQASVTFSSIPTGYKDLSLKCSIRNDQAVVNDQLEIAFNTSANTEHSRTQIAGNGSTASSSRSSNNTFITIVDGANGNSSTGGTFSNIEFYIPNYNSTSAKPISGDIATETNATATFRIATAGLWNSTSPVTIIKLTMGGGSPTVNFVSGSSFYLYGIKAT